MRVRGSRLTFYKKVWEGLAKTLQINGGLEPGLQAQIKHFLAHPPDHILGGGDAGLDHTGWKKPHE